MTKSEMEQLIAGMGEMFREYLGHLSAEDELPGETYISPQRNAENVFRGLLAWLEKDANNG